jgi:non-specific serine/threonine protein kinase
MMLQLNRKAPHWAPPAASKRGTSMSADAGHIIDGSPRYLGSFVGRERELDEIIELLVSARLFTLTGAGGSGKTRLAVQVATRLADAFPDGVFWLNLEALSDAALVPDAVAVRCGVLDSDSESLIEALTKALRARRALLVLDNCEHVLEACASLAATLLPACPHLQILATSREALAIPGEVIWLVRPLPVPDDDAPAQVADALAFAGVELFVKRASAVLPELDVAPENLPHVVHICRLTGGLPLALELAAARLQGISLSDLAVRLDDACALLTGGNRAAHPRQRSLHATLDWSYELLPEEQRQLFVRLAVFAGSFSLDAAEAVCAGGGDSASAVMVGLAELVQKSLLVVEQRRTETRYRLLEPLRQYARRRLEASVDGPEVRRRHRDWYAELAARAAEQLESSEQEAALDRLGLEYDNLRAALHWSLEHDVPEGSGQLVASLWQFWLLRGYLHEARLWLSRVLDVLPEPTALRAQLLWIAGIMSRRDVRQGQQHFEAALAIWEQLGDAAGVARTLASLGFLLQSVGDHRRAMVYLDRSLALARESTDTVVLARILTGLALSTLQTGDARRAGDLCLEGLALYQQLGISHGTAAALANLGLIRQSAGDERHAAALWTESLKIRRRIGDVGGMAHVLVLLGDLAARRGDDQRAIECFQESLVLRSRMDDLAGLAPALEGLAAAGARGADPEDAVRLMSTAATLRSTIGVPAGTCERNLHAQTLAALRARLGARAFADLWAEGVEMPLEQALNLALKQDSQGRVAASSKDEQHVSLLAPPADPGFELTRRELDVLRQITLGLTYAEIGMALGISARTVDAHIRSIFSKLGVRSRSAATRVALQHNLV